jgi:hypothetical protein
LPGDGLDGADGSELGDLENSVMSLPESWFPIMHSKRFDIEILIRECRPARWPTAEKGTVRDGKLVYELDGKDLHHADQDPARRLPGRRRQHREPAPALGEARFQAPPRRHFSGAAVLHPVDHRETLEHHARRPSSPP